jgi:hypothetical protein
MIFERGAGFSYSMTAAVSDNTNTGGERFGYSISMRADGTYMLVGQPYKAFNGVVQGGVRLYQRASSTNWPTISVWGAGNIPNAQLGYSVALSGDGKYALLGAPGAKVGTQSRQGMIFSYYSSTGVSWSAYPNITDTYGLAGEAFGSSICVDTTASNVLVGSGACASGAVHSFTGSGATWTQQPTPVLGYGSYAAISGNAVRAFVTDPIGTGLVRQLVPYVAHAGTAAACPSRVPLPSMSPSASPSTSQVASVSVSMSISLSSTVSVTRSVSGTMSMSWSPTPSVSPSTPLRLAWVAAAPLTCSPVNISTLSGFGTGVALSANGNTTAVGAPGSMRDGVPNAGAVFVYLNTSGMWLQQAELTPPTPAAPDFFGATVRG